MLEILEINGKFVREIFIRDISVRISLNRSSKLIYKEYNIGKLWRLCIYIYTKLMK